jgi:hypothetical protein
MEMIEKFDAYLENRMNHQELASFESAIGADQALERSLEEYRRMYFALKASAFKNDMEKHISGYKRENEDLFQKHFLGQLSAADEAVFAERMQNDAWFASEFDIFKSALELIYVFDDQSYERRKTKSVIVERCPTNACKVIDSNEVETIREAYRDKKGLIVMDYDLTRMELPKNIYNGVDLILSCEREFATRRPVIYISNSEDYNAANIRQHILLKMDFYSNPFEYIKMAFNDEL